MNDSPSEQIKTLIAIALTFASGAMDVTSFTRLGNVFASVMTGNIVLLGLAVARGSLTLASHTAVSIGGYVAGVAAGTLIAHFAKVARAGAGEAEGEAERACCSDSSRAPAWAGFSSPPRRPGCRPCRWPGSPPP